MKTTNLKLSPADPLQEQLQASQRKVWERDVLLDRTLFSLTPEQTTALLADLEDPGAAAMDQASIERLLAMPQSWHAPT
ncbi:MAG: hypothetical protein K9J75_09220 [Cyanobium usitatum Tobar12.5m-G36]|nr:hypothetical protein [Cyanobium usitatum Tobar12.5m-G36]